MSNHIPDVFLFAKEEKGKKSKSATDTYIAANGKVLDPREVELRYSEQKKYLAVMFELDYIKNQDAYDKKIQDSVDLIELDESFKEVYMEHIERNYQLFESIYIYYTSVTEFLADVSDGKYIEFTMETTLQEPEGKRLILECLYQYGVMLLLLDRLIPALARERFLTCYIRYSGSSQS